MKVDRILFFFVFVGTFLRVNGQVSSSEEVSLLFVGDVMQHGGQINAAHNKRIDAYDYDDGFKFVRPIIEEHDIAIANLEVTHAGKPYAGYPQFSAPEELSAALQTAGFDILLTCNNHSCDGGAKGVIRTLDILDQLGINHTGTFRNKAERDKNYPLMIDQKGMKIAVLNYTYGTNGLTVAPPLIINYIDSAVIRKDVEKAKQLKADYIICTMHWGTEYEPLPSDYQKKWEKFCYDLGVNMVIGGHPHVVQPIELETVQNKEQLTVWSLGNYVSNQRDRYKNGGLMVSTSLHRDKEKSNHVSISHANYLLCYVHVKQEQAIKSFYILPDFNYNLYRPEFLSNEELEKMRQFFSDSRQLFAQHNKGISEIKVPEQSRVADIYRAYLQGYYTVQIEKRSDSQVPSYRKSVIAPYLHKIIQVDGTYIYAGEASQTLKSAQGNRQFLSDCSIGSAMKIIYVTPTEIKVIEE